ncbi:polysaccharide lyase family 14 protein [Suillus brevipes Sb2]|nr:polysaccharide lyase family 14 protein [Suillus brevipes Sb2]
MALFFVIALAIPTVLTASAAPSVSQSFHSPASTSVSVGTTYLLTPLQTAVTTVITIVVTDVATTTIAITPTSTSTVVETVTTTTTVTTPSIPWGNRTAWAAPPDMKDLSAFNVTHFPSGKQNVAIIDSISALAIVPGGSVYAQDIIESQSTTNTQNVTGFTSALQLVYPAYSVNPSSKSPGGAEFYASPLNLSDAKNVTMEYSVYFPADFDWVKGGKLPGLYGGHTGCSGGAAAEDCFSTRLMWRQGGAGELYLYAPKRKQTNALCSDPQSVCDAEYGLSIGRGSFHYSTGNWTTLRQDVVLNTPGKQDGAFALFVNGMQAIKRTDIFYRDAPQQKKKPKSKTISNFLPSSSPQQTRGGLLGILAVTATAQEAVASHPSVIRTAREAPTVLIVDKISVSSNTTTSDSSDKPAVGFVGLFFSTFFGGHGDGWATPKQQYTWFKDFAITRNF